jgi:hypothetical protein
MRKTSYTVDEGQTKKSKKKQDLPLARRVIELLNKAPKRVMTCRTTVVEINVQGFLLGALTRRRYPY